MKKLIRNDCNDPAHGEVMENISILNHSSFLASPFSDEIYGYIGGVLLFDYDELNYTFNIYSINHLPRKVYYHDDKDFSIVMGAQDRTQPSFQQQILESGVSLRSLNVKLPGLEKINTVDYFAAERHIDDFITRLTFHYSKIFESLRKETGEIFRREHLFFIPDSRMKDFRSPHIYKKFESNSIEFNVNAMLVGALDNNFPYT